MCDGKANESFGFQNANTVAPGARKFDVESYPMMTTRTGTCGDNVIGSPRSEGERAEKRPIEEAVADPTRKNHRFGECGPLSCVPLDLSEIDKLAVGGGGNITVDPRVAVESCFVRELVLEHVDAFVKVSTQYRSADSKPCS